MRERFLCEGFGWRCSDTGTLGGEISAPEARFVAKGGAHLLTVKRRGSCCRGIAEFGSAMNRAWGSVRGSMRLTVRKGKRSKSWNRCPCCGGSASRKKGYRIAGSRVSCPKRGAEKRHRGRSIRSTPSLSQFNGAKKKDARHLHFKSDLGKMWKRAGDEGGGCCCLRKKTTILGIVRKGRSRRRSERSLPPYYRSEPKKANRRRRQKKTYGDRRTVAEKMIDSETRIGF